MQGRRGGADEQHRGIGGRQRDMRPDCTLTGSAAHLRVSQPGSKLHSAILTLS
jgi:hypothetical protein